jgi:hypothetical protein
LWTVGGGARGRERGGVGDRGVVLGETGEFESIRGGSDGRGETKHSGRGKGEGEKAKVKAKAAERAESWVRLVEDGKEGKKLRRHGGTTKREVRRACGRVLLRRRWAGGDSGEPARSSLHSVRSCCFMSKGLESCAGLFYWQRPPHAIAHCRQLPAWQWRGQHL